MKNRIIFDDAQTIIYVNYIYLCRETLVSLVLKSEIRLKEDGNILSDFVCARVCASVFYYIFKLYIYNFKM